MHEDVGELGRLAMSLMLNVRTGAICHVRTRSWNFHPDGEWRSRFHIFLHGVGQPRVITAAVTDLLRDVLAREAALPEDGQFVFVGAVAMTATGELDGDHEPVDIEVTIEALQVRGHTHARTRPSRSKRWADETGGR